LEDLSTSGLQHHLDSIEHLFKTLKFYGHPISEEMQFMSAFISLPPQYQEAATSIRAKILDNLTFDMVKKMMIVEAKRKDLEITLSQPPPPKSAATSPPILSPFLPTMSPLLPVSPALWLPNPNLYFNPLGSPLGVPHPMWPMPNPMMPNIPNIAAKVCTHCGMQNHTVAECWKLNPGLFHNRKRTRE